jgi:hemerythrin-like domain-containing protein
MKLTDALKNEHVGIKEMLSVLNKMVDEAALEQDVIVEKKRIFYFPPWRMRVYHEMVVQ